MLNCRFKIVSLFFLWFVRCLTSSLELVNRIVTSMLDHLFVQDLI